MPLPVTQREERLGEKREIAITALFGFLTGYGGGGGEGTELF
jgi:hypothetical protein